MYEINRFLNLVGLVGSIFLIVALNALPGFIILSLLVVPATWLWAKYTDQSYHALIDSNGFLYKINKFGQWTWVIVVCIFVTYLSIWLMAS